MRASSALWSWARVGLGGAGTAAEGWAGGRGPWARRFLGVFPEEMHGASEARRLGRSLLQLDLAAEENQVYLFMVIFGAILFATPPMVKLYRHCFTGGTGGYDPSAQLEMWDFTDEFDDMRHVKDPLEEENKRGRKGKKKAKKKKSKETETPGKRGVDMT